MKKKEVVLAGIIGWVAGPFTFVYLGKKTPIRALIELLAILAVIYATNYMVAIPFVLGYAGWGALAAQKHNNALKRQAKLSQP